MVSVIAGVKTSLMVRETTSSCFFSLISRHSCVPSPGSWHSCHTGLVPLSQAHLVSSLPDPCTHSSFVGNIFRCLFPNICPLPPGFSWMHGLRKALLHAHPTASYVRYCTGWWSVFLVNLAMMASFDKCLPPPTESFVRVEVMSVLIVVSVALSIEHIRSSVNVCRMRK